MRFRLPKTYTVLIAGTGKAPITLSIQPIPLLIGAVVIASLPAVAIAYLTHHSTRLAQQNQQLSDTAAEVLTELDSLDTEIEDLKQRAGLSSPDTSGPRSRAESPLEGPADRAHRNSGGPNLAVEATSLFELAQRKLPMLSLSLEADVKPALEETLAEEADREAAFPSGLPLKGDISVSSEFGLRRNPFGGSRYEMHAGLDFRGPIGRPVYATAEGSVKTASAGNGYGKHIVIDHGYGYETLYAHLSDFNVKAGDQVTRGDLIGFLGNTGRSSGPHLHYGVYRDRQPVNPRHYAKLMPLAPAEDNR
jgi:murein DD-endopeptidase MepM/ murein hydrolase activator NlpD